MSHNPRELLKQMINLVAEADIALDATRYHDALQSLNQIVPLLDRLIVSTQACHNQTGEPNLVKLRRDTEWDTTQQLIEDLKREPAVRLYVVGYHLKCRQCGHQGPVRYHGSWYPSLRFLSPAVGFGGTIPYQCPNCRAEGLAGVDGLEGYRNLFDRIDHIPDLTDCGVDGDIVTSLAAVEKEPCPLCCSQGVVTRYGKHHSRKRIMELTPATHRFCPHCLSTHPLTQKG